MSYAELHCLSCFSFQRGASLPKELFARAKAVGYAALAITDECSLAGIVKAHDAAKEQGLKLIVGTELRLEDGPKLVLLAPDKRAYEAMSGIVTRGRQWSTKGEYRLLCKDLEQGFPDRDPSSLLALWIPGAAPDPDHAAWVRDRFPGRAWIAVELHRGPDDAAHLERLRALGMRYGLPLVAAGDVHYDTRDRRALQDVLTAIRHGMPVAECGLRLFPNGERHLRSMRDLRAIYPADLLDETIRIAERCSFQMTDVHYDHPRELIPDGGTPIGYLRELTHAGMQRRWPQGTSAKVAAQIEKELVLIEEKKYEAFFLVVHDLVREARERGILCQGRGSAANSAVCYALGVTAVDPDRSKLLFERFVSRERDEAPDIDVDFEHERREEIIQYVFDKYGHDRAALAATVIHYRPKMAIRDVGKALGAAPDQIDALAKSLAWWDRHDELPQRLREIGLDPEAPMTCRWLRLVREILGLPRHLSQHVGGFVISNEAVSRLVPIENAAMKDRQIIQWDKEDLESLGLLKVDVLALGMLTALRRTLAMLEPRYGPDFGIDSIEDDDADTYAMIQRADTIGVFQIESRAQMTMLPRLKPENYFDLVVEVAIVRPGPIQGGMVHPYLKRRLERERNPAAEFDCPAVLKEALARTLGVPLFQEQVMQIAIDGAGFSPGKADHVRRSMAAWKRHGGLEHFHDELIEGMVARGLTAEYAERIHQMILGFGSYGFPESHAASFALLAYDSAWLKCHEPAAFFAGLLNSQPMGFYAPSQLVQQARRQNVEVRPVDVMVSGYDCALEDWPAWRKGEPTSTAQPALRLGLCLVKGLSDGAAERIEKARAQAPFADVEDLVERARLNAHERNALAEADALRALAGHRHRARWRVLGSERMPALLEGRAAREPELDLHPPREAQEILADYASTGLTLRRHPVALLRARLDAWQVRRASEIAEIAGGCEVRVAGLVVGRQRPQTANGTVFITLEDETGSHNLVVREAVMREHRRAALGARFLIVSGELQKAEGIAHVVAHRFHDASRWIGALAASSRDFH